MTFFSKAQSLVAVGCLVGTLFAPSLVKAQQQSEPLNKGNFDLSVRAQDDLYEYVNGTWLKETEIPGDKSNYGAFTVLSDLSQKRIKAIVDEVSKGNNVKGTDEQKVADLFRSFMDEARVNELKATPVQQELASIEKIDDKAALIEWFAKLGSLGISSPIGSYVGQDKGEATNYIMNVSQSGLSLPDRDYYLNEDKQADRDNLLAYIKKLFTLAEIPEQSKFAEAILKLETDLAEAQWSRVETRDAEKTYNKMGIAELNKLSADVIDWNKYFQDTGVAEPLKEVVVSTPSFFEKLATIIESTDLDVWKAYLQFRYINAAASYLSDDFVEAKFTLYGKQLSGIEEQKPRWKRGINLVSGRALGEVVGKLYVQKHFKPEAKIAMEKLVANLLQAYDDSIDDLTWMSEETKVKAKDKLSKITPKIGYPNVWRDYSKLEIEADDLFGNVMRSNLVEHERNISKLGKPIDREEWGMTPQTINAYYRPTMNEIVFPAAILQPPFFDIDAPAPLNYGGIGAVIGHEISHGFDDQGSKYDGDGNLDDWWTKEDREAFTNLTKQLVDQFSVYEPLKGEKVNGKLTLGENIADLSGLAIAHRALLLSKDESLDKMVAGLNSDQLFFVGWSRVWKRKYRAEEMVKRLLDDNHSPSQFRVNGPITNIDAFYKAFDIKPSDKLYRPEDQRIKIW
ncbi:M13 family metallopeptidase [Mariniblastus sp.]|nr:M13 family metallopeptidase [Mariniblastus sp.]